MNEDAQQENDQRKYWAQKLDEAHDFMLRVQHVQILDCGEPLEFLPAAAASKGVEIVFSDAPFARSFDRQFYLRKGLISKFVSAALEMNERGWVMKVEDAYRSPDMQKALQRTPEIFESFLPLFSGKPRG